MARRRATSRPGPYLKWLELIRSRVPEPKTFPFNLPAFQDLERLPFHPKVTFIIGENGSGKSTLVEALAVACGLNPEGGSRNFNFATRASHSPFGDAVRLARTVVRPSDSYFLRAESFYNVASEIERLDEDPGGGPRIIDAYGGESLHQQSHGESFFALFKNRLRDNGLFLMDEPEAALSPYRQLEFLVLLHDYATRGCQFIIATHSPVLMAYPDARIYLLDESGINETTYKNTDHYLIMSRFLANPERGISELIAPPDLELFPDLAQE